MKVSRAAIVLVGSILGGLVLAGCGSTPGQAVLPPQEASSSGAESSSPAPGQITGDPAPKVATPLDPAKFLADPCAVLTPEQLQRFVITKPPRPKGVSGSGNPGCQWTAGRDYEDATIGINFDQSTGDGLQRLYDLDASGQWKDGYFEPMELGGYPAAFVSIDDARPTGDCDLAVAITDQLVFVAGVIGRPGTDGCKAALNTAEAYLETIKAG
ncbi:hypothetical protein CFN78_02610 [Amycolatopsis antarctica]|uniref:DUF3558 domain-containing protein n=1 Tax=Amycolatopsis antarctica TaxID=1854586 RepID=A0A263DCI1_9PSEU|nr:DUF3558 domain-containing protein [Amycolatopsis antarctica]OZM75085.1 hypothetical protein CFN78_02610 [Amycolatopsis antarctica]